MWGECVQRKVGGVGVAGRCGLESPQSGAVEEDDESLQDKGSEDQLTNQ